MSICDFPDDDRERLLALSGPRMWEAPIEPDPGVDGFSWGLTAAERADVVAQLVALQDGAA